MSLKFYNTLSKIKEEFIPIDKNEVRMYTCGPTVYNYAHIGNLRAYVFSDILRRTLKYCGFRVNQVMNITDVGHLSSDADSGEDKMSKGLAREGKTLTLENMRKLAEFYAEKFKEDTKKLNIETPDEIHFASDCIKDDIELIKKLERNGYAYKTSDGIYFDTAKFSDYGILRGGKMNWNEKGARTIQNSEKKNPEDFALWKFDQKIGFSSIFGQGFPGWHIECSAMSMKYLGEQFDIHTGGVDHISIHHTNEIAQSEAATGKKPFVRFWMHNEFVDIGGEKMAKSDDNFLKLSSLTEKNIDPAAYRFWLLMGHYRTKMNFNWEALEGAEIALKRLFELYKGLQTPPWWKFKKGQINKDYQRKFKEYLSDDLDTPGALTVLWDIVKDEKISDIDKKATILDFDKVLGLGFENLKPSKKIKLKTKSGKFTLKGGEVSFVLMKGGKVPDEIMKLVKEREKVRKNKDFKKSDELRNKINSLGYQLKDLESGVEISKF